MALAGRRSDCDSSARNRGSWGRGAGKNPRVGAEPQNPRVGAEPQNPRVGAEPQNLESARNRETASRRGTSDTGESARTSARKAASRAGRTLGYTP